MAEPREAALRAALAAAPNDPAVHAAFAQFCAEQGRFAEAAAAYRAAIAAAPRRPDLLNNYGCVLMLGGDLAAARTVFDSIAAIDPHNFEAAMNLARLAHGAGAHGEAIAQYRRALQVRPADVTARLALANALDGAREGEEALALVRSVLPQAGGDLRVICLYAHLQLRYCDWSDWPRTLRALGPATEAADAAGILDQVPASLYLMLPVAPALRGRVAAAHARLHARAAAASGWQPPPHVPARDGRIRLGYLSGRFTRDATGQLTVDLFPAHDRARFAVSAFSFGPDDGSDERRRIAAGADRFVDLAAHSHVDAAQAIADAGIDILVDLDGFVMGARPQIAALRPAPIQLRYLDFPGTTGAGFFDYLVTDRIVTPPSDQPLYAERFAYLPGCYQVNAASQAADTAPVGRADCALAGFDTVFCSFNTNTKLEPGAFALWMEILAAVPNSALWLLGESKLGERNLRAEAHRRGIDPLRLVFAPFVERAKHLARLANADLFLDSFVYNAHTTASDALWAGVPVLTLPGDSFASRVGASLVTAAGLPELVARSPADYKAIAIALAGDPARR
ncbi:MAG: tetratricopeptide repeat protein, partial [Alphaproteobacteria bacterium]|nr:tetratricopeptide repeat protein [Alphaproteobacteria bacterium]